MGDCSALAERAKAVAVATSRQETSTPVAAQAQPIRRRGLPGQVSVAEVEAALGNLLRRNSQRLRGGGRRRAGRPSSRLQLSRGRMPAIRAA